MVRVRYSCKSVCHSTETECKGKRSRGLVFLMRSASQRKGKVDGTVQHIALICGLFHSLGGSIPLA